ncbi:hypothetical protein [Fluviicola sp.]|uniref:hypothetical protein n=1 Tax=Fluviicola sp. TaxID=1917219 RepID=UPI0031D724E3
MLDGIYYNGVKFFRFYKDGTLLDCLIKGEGDRKQVAGWLKKENVISGVIKGRYTSRNGIISFSTPDRFGDGRMINYTGKANGGKEILLTSLNHNTGRKIVNERFVRLL